ncbi:hypothetical protein P7D72_01875 [Enterococcus avium]|uniref:hypothetical protein n=1 Tax=Enterococcus avium TaxID=33945 RepID=UPI002892533C|nr:hypothetical protein [Enterococcus avium]MDT2490796.1 hypothetical protein [Enterococcus avium]
MNEINQKEFIKKIISGLSQEYTERLLLLYPEAYKENPEAFPLADLKELDIYLVKADRRILTSSFFVILNLGTGIFHEVWELPDSHYSDFKNFSGTWDFIPFVLNKEFGLQNIYLVSSFVDNYLTGTWNDTSIDEYIDIQKEWLGNIAREQLLTDARGFTDHINQSASYYAKDAFKYAYSDLDFEPIIKVVNDPDFEYALNESLAAYDHSLYLAATSTAGTAMENLIRRILELENTPVSENETTELGELTGRLRRAQIIDKRDKRRIMLAADFRNLASHGNKGRVIRQDTKLIYQEIFNLALNYFEQ